MFDKRCWKFSMKRTLQEATRIQYQQERKRMSDINIYMKLKQVELKFNSMWSFKCVLKMNMIRNEIILLKRWIVHWIYSFQSHYNFWCYVIYWAKIANDACGPSFACKVFSINSNNTNRVILVFTLFNFETQNFKS